MCETLKFLLLLLYSLFSMFSVLLQYDEQGFFSGLVYLISQMPPVPGLVYLILMLRKFSVKRPSE